jgi:hypothetical protein
MTDENQTDDAREAGDMGEKPDLGRTRDALKDALSGSDMGSDTRAGSLRGGAASGSDIDPDQDAINEMLASEGMATAEAKTPGGVDPEPVNNTGEDKSAGKSADAATG